MLGQIQMLEIKQLKKKKLFALNLMMIFHLTLFILRVKILIYVFLYLFIFICKILLLN